MDWEKYEVKNQIEISAFYSLFEKHLPSDWNFEGEVHDFWECVYVIKGDIYASGDGRVYNLKSGEMIFHEPMEFHKLSLLGSSEADALIFSYSSLSVDRPSSMEDMSMKMRMPLYMISMDTIIPMKESTGKSVNGVSTMPRMMMKMLALSASESIF